MPRAIVFFASLLALLTFHSVSVATTVTENFNSGFNANNFTATDSDPNSTFQASDGQLNFVGTASTATSERGGTLMSTFALPGDFTATVDLTNFSAPFEGAGKFCVARIELFSSGGYYGSVGRLRGMAAGLDQAELSLATQGSIASINTSDSSGVLELDRSGNNLSGYWDDQLIGSGVIPSGPVTISLLAERYGALSSFDASFDNFVITGVPEPTSLGLLTLALLPMLRRTRGQADRHFRE